VVGALRAELEREIEAAQRVELIDVKAQRVAVDQAFELGEQVEVPAAGQLGLDPVLDRVEPDVAEAPCLTFEQQAPTSVHERIAAPHRQRFAQHRCGGGAITAVEGAPPFGDKTLETAGVDDVGIDA